MVPKRYWQIVQRKKILLLHGSDDRISVEGSRSYENTKSCNIEFEGNYHELHFDKDRDKVAQVVSSWIMEGMV